MDRSFCLQQSVLLLELVLDIIPGHLTGYLMLAEVQIQLDEFDSAQCTLQAALGLDHTFAAAQLLLSQVCLLDRRGLRENHLIVTFMVESNRFNW